VIRGVNPWTKGVTKSKGLIIKGNFFWITAKGFEVYDGYKYFTW